MTPRGPAPAPATDGTDTAAFVAGSRRWSRRNDADVGATGRRQQVRISGAANRAGRSLSRCVARASGLPRCAPDALLRRVAGILVTFLVLPCGAPAEAADATAATPVRVAASPSRGFAFPYFLVIPDAIETSKSDDKTYTLLVLPNNTGHPDDDVAVHETAAREMAALYSTLAERTGTVLLVPAFPRPTTPAHLYTHALNRAALRAAEPSIKRLDLQLIAMCNDARRALGDSGIALEPRILLFGFSAAGMFANRFTFLHPSMVKAAVIGSPGGWPLLPLEQLQGQKLSYPVGVADLAELTGAPLDLATLVRVPLFFYFGADDQNDSVASADSYEPRERQLVLSNFGTSLSDRWEDAGRIYARVLPLAEFHLYPHVGDTTDKAWSDITP